MMYQHGEDRQLQATLAPWAAALAISVGLAACAGSGSAQRAKVSQATFLTSLPSCPPAISTNITQISASGKTATIKLQDPRMLPPTGAGLRWKLNTNGYTFTNDGIGIASPPAGAASASTGTEYQWCFGSTTDGTQWKYSIN